MMGQALEYAGRDVGRFFIPPDKRDSGATTQDIAFFYFLGSAESSGGSSMSGTLRADWICGEEQLGFEFHRILHCKFTFTPEMGAKPLLNDVYKRLPTNVTQKLRKPHIDQVFDGSFGRCLHFRKQISHPNSYRRTTISNQLRIAQFVLFSLTIEGSQGRQKMLMRETGRFSR